MTHRIGIFEVKVISGRTGMADSVLMVFHKGDYNGKQNGESAEWQ